MPGKVTIKTATFCGPVVLHVCAAAPVGPSMTTIRTRQQTAACRAKPRNAEVTKGTRNFRAATITKPANNKAKRAERFFAPESPFETTKELEGRARESFATATWEPTCTPSMVTVRPESAPG